MLINDCIITIADDFPYECPYTGIYIYLIPREWNDFGLKISYFINVFINGRKFDLGGVKIYCDDYESVNPFVLKNGFLPQNTYSLGQSKLYYEVLASLDSENRIAILKAMCDICYDDDLYKSVIKLDAFKSSLARFIKTDDIDDDFIPLARAGYSSGFLGFAYRFPREYSCSEEMSFKINLSSSINNIFAVVGANGVGKTTFFKDLLSCLYGLSTNAQISQNYSDKKKIFNNVIHISYTGFDDKKFENIYKSINEKNNLNNYPSFYHFNLNENFNYDDLKLMIMSIINNKKESLLFNEILSLYEKDRYFNCECFLCTKNYIEKQIEYNETKSALALANAKDLYSKIFDSYPKLSSGQKFIYRTTIQLISNISPNSLILIDEPENHLHPPLLSMYINALSKIASNSNSLLISATHSPVVLQEILSSNVYCLSRKDNVTCFCNPLIQTYGASYQEIVFDIFRCEVINTGFYSKLNALVKQYNNYEKIMEILGGQLGTYGQGLLKLMCSQYEKDSTTNN